MLKITELHEDMANALYVISQDDDTRRFIPDEVFESVDIARVAIAKLKSFYNRNDAPQVYAVILEDKTLIGYVQAVPIDNDWEIGYKTAKDYTGRGYATQAVKSFLPWIMERLCLTRIYGIILSENTASGRVLEKCGFTLEYQGPAMYQGTKRGIRKYRLDI